jgi:hypothetical protein
MTRKSGKAQAAGSELPGTPPGFPRRSIDVHPGRTPEATAANLAKMISGSDTAAYRVIAASEKQSGFFDVLDTPAMREVLREQAKAVQAGDLGQAEAMLINQAVALQSLFARLAERGMSVETVPAFEANMRFALMAQRQSAKALETLALIKQGPAVIARSANVVNGQQQVNLNATESARSVTSGVASRAQGGDNHANELFSRLNDEREEVELGRTEGVCSRVPGNAGSGSFRKAV